MMQQIYTVEMDGFEFELYSSRKKAEDALIKFCNDKGFNLRIFDRFNFGVGEYPFYSAKIKILIVL